MREFIKKALIGTVLLLLVITIFWQTLTATAFWGLAVYQAKDHGATKLTPEPELVLPIATSTASSTAYGTVQIPHLFTQTEVLQAPDGVRVVFSDNDSNAYYLISVMGTYKDGFLAGQSDATATEFASLCSGLTNIYTTNPCLSDRTFISAVMETSNKTARLFSSPERKNAAATFLLLKTTYVPGATSSITPFQSPEISGYLAYEPIDSIAYLFDINETGYEIVFVHMDQAEIESVLASISSYE